MLMLVKHSMGANCSQCRNERLKHALDDAGIEYSCSNLREVMVTSDFPESRQVEINGLLRIAGITLISDRTQVLVEGMKSLLGSLIEPPEKLRGISIRKFLASQLYYSYSHLSKVFLKISGQSPEHYLIEKKVERIKEMLSLEHLTLTEISYRLNYSSVAHLSHQFRKATGMSATEWKRSHSERSTKHTTALRELAILLIGAVTMALISRRSFVIESIESILTPLQS